MKPVAYVSIVVVTAACGVREQEMFTDDSPLDATRVYLIYGGGAESGHRVRDAEANGMEWPGPPLGGLTGVTLFADGSLLYGSTGRIERFVPDGMLTILNDHPCAEGLLTSIAVHPDSQQVVHGCRRVFDAHTELYSAATRHVDCPSDQELLAAGFKGSILCSGSIVDGAGSVYPIELADREVAAVRAAEDGGFWMVLRTRVPRSEALYAFTPDGQATKVGDYPALPEMLDGKLVIGIGAARARETALLNDGTYYQLALLETGLGPNALFRLRAGEKDAVHLAGALPMNTNGRLVTGP